MSGRALSRRARLLLALLLLAVGLFAGAWLHLYSGTAHEALSASLPASAAIPDSLAPHPKQGPDECGAYSLAYGLSLCAEEADPRTLVEEITDVAAVRMLSGTRPWKLQAALTARGFLDTGYSAAHVPAARRLELPLAHVAAGRPTLCLIESERGIQHYVLLLGYGPAGVDIYDPNAEVSPVDPARTVDANGPRSGNRTLPRADFTALWERGGALGLYRWWYLPLVRG